jgi:hypothetical protein
MAKASVFTRFNKKDMGWSGPWGTGESSMADHQRGVDNSSTHAERQAWEKAMAPANGQNIQAWFNAAERNFPELGVQIKIVVDQQVCPSCQQYILETVLTQMKTLKVGKRSLQLFVEVNKTIIGVARDTVWPKEIGQLPRPLA